MNGKCWKPAVNFDALWYWTHCDNILLAWAVKHLPTGCWTSACYNLTHHNCHTSSPGHSMQKAKYVRDYVAAERKTGQLYIFIRREWITLCVKINGMPPPRVQVFVHDRMEGKFNQSIKWSWTWQWQESSHVPRLWAHTDLVTFTPMINKPQSHRVRPTCAQKLLAAPPSASRGPGLCKPRFPQSFHCWAARGI